MTHARYLFPLVVTALCIVPSVAYAQETENLIQVQTKKSAARISQEIEAAAKRHGYGVLGKRNITETLASKSLSVDENVIVFDLCSPRHAKMAIDEKVAVATVLPCNIAVWEQDGSTTLAMVKPTLLLGLVSSSKEMTQIAQQVEKELHLVMKEVAQSGKTK